MGRPCSAGHDAYGPPVPRSAPLIALLACLSGCGAPPAALPPPAATGTVVVQIWDPGAAQPTTIVAERVAQIGQRFDRLALTAVRSRIILPDLDAALTAPSGTWMAQDGVLTLDGPVHLAGTWQGRPVVGVSANARLVRDDSSIELADLEMWNQGQRLFAPVAILNKDRTLIAPRGLTTSPLPPELAAAFAALPDPLPLPH